MQRISRRVAIGSAVVAAGATGVFAGQWFARPTVTAQAASGSIAETPLFNDPHDPVLGNPHGTLPIAEFFDYRCPFCHRMHPLVARLLMDNPDLRYVAKEWPVFGGPSVTAARVALAANWQSKFAAVNDALFTADGPLDETRIDAAAQRAGLDMARLHRDLSGRDAELRSMLGRVSMQAASLGLQVHRRLSSARTWCPALCHTTTCKRWSPRRGRNCNRPAGPRFGERQAPEVPQVR